MVAKVEVKGLRELQAEMAKVNPKLPRELTKAHKKIAKTIREAAAYDMRSLFSTKTDEAAEGLKATAGQKWAGIRMAGENPFVRAVEFGTTIHHVFGRPMLVSSMTRRVFQPWAGNGADAGYALYPTLRDHLKSEEFMLAYNEALNAVFKGAFPKGRF